MYLLASAICVLVADTKSFLQVRTLWLKSTTENWSSVLKSSSMVFIASTVYFKREPREGLLHTLQAEGDIRSPSQAQFILQVLTQAQLGKENFCQFLQSTQTCPLCSKHVLLDFGYTAFLSSTIHQFISSQKTSLPFADNARLTQEPVCFCLPRAGIINTCYHAWFFHLGVGDQTHHHGYTATQQRC